MDLITEDELGTIVKLRDELIPVQGEPAKAVIVKGGWHLPLDVDYCARVAAMFYALRNEYGTFTVYQEILAKRIAALSVQLEKLEEDFIYRNHSNIKPEDLNLGMENLLKAMSQLEDMMKRRPPPVYPSPDKYHRSN